MYSAYQFNIFNCKLFTPLFSCLIALSAIYSSNSIARENFYWDNVAPYTLDSGVFATIDSRIGTITTGTFIQNGGTHSTSTLRLGTERDSSGFYYLNDGILRSGYTYIGYSYGYGEFHQNGGSHTTSHNSAIFNGIYNLNDGVFDVYGSLTNYGTINISGGEFSAGSIRNYDSFNINEGANDVQIISGLTTNTGNINLVDGKSIVFENDVFGSGNFNGGTRFFNNIYQPGTEYLPPPDIGDPIRYFLANGAILGGDTIFEDTATLRMYLLDDGQSDWLTVNGSAQLDGTLNLLIGQEGYTPQIGDSWEILVGEGIYGSFDSIISNAPSEWDWVVDYMDDRVIVTAVEATVVPIPAAIWLFGSGLLGLVGMTLRGKVN